MPENILKVLFAINPSSGGKKKMDWESGIRKYMKSTSHKADFFVLTGKDDKTSLQYYIKQIQPDRVVAVGGDGTIKLLAEVLLNSDIALAILPGGSSNGLATELEIPSEMGKALNIVFNGVEKNIDVISLGGNNICLHLSDFGLNATLVKYSEINNWKGKLGYARGMVRMLVNKRLVRARIELDDKVIKRKSYMIVLANAKKYGTGAVINPSGKIADGFFEIVVVKKISFWTLIKMFYKKRHFNPNKVEIFRTSKAIIKLNKSMNFQIDGEYLGKTNSVKAVALKQKLKVIVAANNDL